MKLLLPLFAFLLAQPLHAQWNKLPMPAGGNIQFAGTAHNRVWTDCSTRTYFSDDQGITWHHWALQDSLEARSLWISNSTLMAISRAPNPSTLGTKEAVFKSTDNGDSWQRVFYDSLQPAHVQHAFSAGGYLYFVKTGSLSGNYLFRSGDNGASWQNVDVGGNGTEDKQLYSVTAGGNVLIAGLYIVDGIGDPTWYQLKSLDFGQTWTPFGLPYFQGNCSVDIQDNCWIVQRSYNPNNSYFYVSFNSGTTFQQVPLAPCHDRMFFAPPDNLYSYDYYSNECIQRLDVSTLSWLPVESPPTYCQYPVQTEDGTLIVGSHNAGMWRKPINAANWVEANEGLPSSVVRNLVFHNDDFFLLNEIGIYNSTDECQTWNNITPPGFLHGIHYWGDTLLATYNEGIYFSKNEGLTWAPLLSAYPDFGKISTQGDTALITIQDFSNNKILYTPNRGNTWHTIAGPPDPTGEKIVDYALDQGRLWALRYFTAGAFFSDDRGQSWTLSGNNDVYSSIFIQQGHIFLAGKPSAYSIDNGVTWHTPTGLPAAKAISSLCSDKNGRWYAVDETGRIYASNNGGVDWSLFDNPGNPPVFSLFARGESLYAYRYPSGLWRRPLVTTGTNTPGEVQDIPLSLFPNPAHQMVEIVWPSDEALDTPLLVYDIDGKMIWKGVEGTTKRIDISAWLPGFYVVKLGKHLSRLIKF